MADHECDVAIAGGGVAGLTAGLTSARAGRKTRVLTGRSLGGQLLSIERIDGYPGFPDGVPGYDLGPIIQEQAAAAGAEFAATEATGLHAEEGRWRLTTGEGDVWARAVVIATGTTLKTLGIPGEERLRGKGVSHCATCDGPLLRGRIVGVVGGGDSALQEALTLAQHVSRVIILHRGPRVLRAGGVRRASAAEPEDRGALRYYRRGSDRQRRTDGSPHASRRATGRSKISNWPACSSMSGWPPRRRGSTACSRSMHPDGFRSTARCAASCPAYSRQEPSDPGRPAGQRRRQATGRRRHLAPIST